MSDRQGQPPKKSKRSGSEKRKRQPRIIFRVSEEERAEMKASAAAAGLSVGSFIRSRTVAAPHTRVVRSLAPTVAEFRQYKGEIGKIGGNLAQFLRLANRGEIVPPDDLAPAVDEVRALIAALAATLEGAV